ncbi:MAG: hypothetical protein IAI50_04110 [Candidatus Eremiobacteraeota bacterium]|nr:hypothetical protein [Candidatus Eremiobacteraeota bacterium]
MSACSSSSGLATGPSSSIDHVVFTNGSGQVNDFFVALSGTVGLSPAAVQVNAVGIQGSNFTPQVVYGATFTWAAAFAAEGTPYSVGSSPNGPHKCGAPSITPAIPIYYQPQNSLVPTPLAANQSANVVYAAAVPKVELVAPGTSYCYNLIATQVGGGTSGSVLVVVSNSP